MEAKILIRTPKGNARGAEQKLRLIIGIKKDVEVFFNDDDDELLWIVKGDSRRVDKAMQNVYRFNAIMLNFMNNSIVKKTVRKLLKEKEADELYDMLLNQTEIEIIKYDKEQELLKDSRSVFQKIKDRIRL
jgi:hypothetical protein